MNKPLTRNLLCALGAIPLTVLPLAGRADCAAHSGKTTTALVELYTSEGCSSCPPADRLLNGLPSDIRVVPLALHVPYWDDLGWKDPYGQAAFADRQRRLVNAAGRRTVYTPQFFIDGVEPPRGAVGSRIGQINATPAAADIRLAARQAGTDRLNISVHAARRDPDDEPAALYLAVAESGLASTVGAGENRGATLPHDHVVRAWIGPIPMPGTTLDTERSVTLAASWKRARLTVAAFVEETRSGRVLQAVSAAQCTGS